MNFDNPIDAQAALSPPVHSGALPSRIPAGALVVVPAAEDAEIGKASLPLSHYLWVLRKHRWALLAFVCVVVAATALVSVRMTPIYESTATLYVDRQEAKGIVGQDAQNMAYANLDAESYLASQIKLLESDSVVRPIAERYGLLEKEKQIDTSADDQQERTKAANATMELKRLKINRPPNTFILQVSYRSANPQLAADVANGIAQSFIEHTYRIRIQSSANLSKFMERQLEELRARMEASSGRLAALERELNVINPGERTSILSARLLQLNAEYTKVQGERAHAESAFNSLQGGAIDAALASSQGEELKKLLARLYEAREHFAAVKTRYGANHPEFEKTIATVKELEGQVELTRLSILGQVQKEYQKVRDQESLLRKDVAETKGEYDSLNQRSFEYQRVKREADADRSLYEELVRKIREAEINAGFENNAVRIADSARPAWKPVLPKLWLNLLLALLLSTFVGVSLAIIIDASDTTIRGPEYVTAVLKTVLIGTLPEVKNRAELVVSSSEDNRLQTSASHPNGWNGSERPGKDRKYTTYDEAIRTILSSILLSDSDNRLKTLLITSAEPSEGKSTVAGHLAVALAEQGRRTLLVDCDLRRPSQHRLFGQPLGAGLSDVLTGEVPWGQIVVRPFRNLPLDVVFSGPPSRRAVDQLGQLLNGSVLDAIRKQYDLIIIDSPPLLGFPESMQMASAADAVAIVTRAGETSRTAVATAISTLHHVRAKLLGLILNQVKRDHQEHSYYYGYYGKNYSKYYKPVKD